MRPRSMIQTTGPNNGHQLRDYSKSSNRSENRPLIFQNSTIGNNGKFYWHTAKERGFYGNQFVETVKLAQLGKRITSITGSVGLLLSSYELYNGYVLDGGNFQTIGYNTVRATVDVAGGWVGGLTGLKIGAAIGGGIGALPGSVIGGTIGGIAGSLGCSWFGVGIVDTVYGR